MGLSVIVITKNEEEDLQRLLDSVAFAEQVVVVDSGSTDRTVLLAQQHGAEVFECDWLGFGPQKNVALSHAREEWVMSLDADEWLPAVTAEQICRIINGNTVPDSDVMAAYSLPRQSYLMGKKIQWGDWRRDRVVRLFRRSQAYFSDDQVHEIVRVRGMIGALRTPIFHEPFKTLNEFQEKLVSYNRLAADRLSRHGKGGHLQAVTHGIFTFFRCAILRLGLLDGWRGLLIAWFNAKGAYFKYHWAGQLAQKAKF